LKNKGRAKEQKEVSVKARGLERKNRFRGILATASQRAFRTYPEVQKKGRGETKERSPRRKTDFEDDGAKTSRRKTIGSKMALTQNTGGGGGVGRNKGAMGYQPRKEGE